MDDEIRANVQPIIPICINDNLEIAINLYSLRGLIDVNSIHWQKPIFSSIPLENTLTYQREKKMIEEQKELSEKIVCDLNRICELEDSQQEWRYPMYESIPENALNFLKVIEKQFLIKEILFANVDILVVKAQLIASKPGYIQYSKALGIGIKIVDWDEECTNEVKKAGLMIERHCDLEVRIGDVFY